MEGRSGVAPPIITLTTDFGLRDVFVGVMKGVILSICPEVQLVDLTHEIAPQDVLEGALALESVAAFFPAGTVHLAVVDPGVGSARRAIALRAGGQYFVGPDNGLFTALLEAGGWVGVSREVAAFRRPEVSRTFHGRDVFAPAAAHLAAGVDLGRLGPALEDPLRLPWPGCRLSGQEIIGEVIGSDRFGNLLTSVTARWLEDHGGATGVFVGDRRLGGAVSCYADGLEGVPTPIMGSSGRLELFVRNGSARGVLGAGRGAPVRVEVGRAA